MSKVGSFVGFVTLVGVFLLSACGGGESGGSGSGGDSATLLSGVAAAGAPIIGQVTVKDALGKTNSAMIEADGSYSVDVAGLTAPFRLRAVGTVGGRILRLHSYAEEADVNGTVNITPFTDLIVANAAQQIASSFFESSVKTSLDPTVVAEQEAALQSKLQDVFSALGVDTAVDLLHTAFSADHSGLGAALDVIRVEVDTNANKATITNLLAKNLPITDDVEDAKDNDDVLTAGDSDALRTAVTDIQAIASVFDNFTRIFAAGLPDRSVIEDYFSTDFYDEDMPKSAFLTDITTDPSLVGLTFSGVSVSKLDPIQGTATVTFYAGKNGYVDPDPIVWLATKTAAFGWQMRGDQRITEMYFNFHCNDYDGSNSQSGSCGINTRFWDNDFTNNGTVSNAPIASGTVTIIDGSDNVTVKDVVYLGTPTGAAPGDVQVYDEANQNYSGDWKAFGIGTGEIDPSIFQVGDIVEYKLYTEALDISVPAAPQIAADAIPVATYQDTLLYAPATTGIYPVATAAMRTAISNFTLGNSLRLDWTLAGDTLSEEVLVSISDASGNSIEIWDAAFAPNATSTTISSTQLDSTAATNAGLDANAANYSLLVRIYAMDPLTGQQHSTDYSAAIPGPAAGASGGSGSTYACNHESGWDDTADGGLGAPVTPNSFADYEAVIAACGTAQRFTAADVSGKTFQNIGNIETMTFNVGTGTAASPAPGIYGDGEGGTIAFQWYVEAATCSSCNYNYLVIYSDTSIDPNLPAAWFRETAALTGVSGAAGVTGAQYSYVKYSEQANYSDSNRAFGSDGEIWNSVDQLK